MSQQANKSLQRRFRAPGGHWVGDGFPVRSLFSYGDGGAELSPFLLFDYAGPQNFPPTTAQLGVGAHPHRGFETVTVVYQGEVEHRDSAGGGGLIGPDEVQWMTAAAGVVHEEFHGRHWAAQGGTLEMAQLWVNLPAAAKMTPPRYQALTRNRIPSVTLPQQQGQVRVIAGAYQGQNGPAQTFSPIQLWDLRLTGIGGGPVTLSLPPGHTTLLAVLHGQLNAGDGLLNAAEVGLYSREGSALHLAPQGAVTALLLCGAPLNEPIVGSGPFVMNTAAEIRQAFADYQSGQMGHLPTS